MSFLHKFNSVLICMALSAVAQQSSAATNMFRFDAWDGPAIRVYSVEPESLPADAPVLFVMHGVRRNAEEYRNNWIDLAHEYKLRVYVPEFDARRFPGARSYNLGGVESDEVSAFAALEPLFEHVRNKRGSSAEGYIMFGHSAGAQYVHRMICVTRPVHLRLAIAANAGWYTLPNASEAWPYGLVGKSGPICDIDQWLRRPLLILLGAEDADPDDQFLRRTKEAMHQGSNRVERGKFFFQTALDAAVARNFPLKWRLEMIPGVGHDNRRMAQAFLPRLRKWLSSWPPVRHLP